ncbi:hypothetical protein [[Kitasatospora] papulosa]|uniref:hypothetical protein n=1 Tax=[Kitasatospora] papulosa TaxID=1464011 RepID=UPI0036A2FC83
MRSLKMATATALAGTALALATPPASASDSRCDPVTAAAMEAKSAYESARTDHQKRIDAGAHRATFDEFLARGDRCGWIVFQAGHDPLLVFLRGVHEGRSHEPPLPC